jgi:hypothetical protein
MLRVLTPSWLTVRACPRMRCFFMGLDASGRIITDSADLTAAVQVRFIQILVFRS